eukprot:scaffold7957_cov108-Isochrysis_galbana.AAC.7
MNVCEEIGSIRLRPRPGRQAPHPPAVPPRRLVGPPAGAPLFCGRAGVDRLGTEELGAAVQAAGLSLEFGGLRGGGAGQARLPGTHAHGLLHAGGVLGRQGRRALFASRVLGAAQHTHVQSP